MKDKTILIHPSGSEIPFDIDHAKRLMAMPNNGGWKWKEEPVDVSSLNDQSNGSNEPEETVDDSSKKVKGNGVRRNSRNQKSTKGAGK